MTTSYSSLTLYLGLMCIRGWVDPQTPLLSPFHLNMKLPGSSQFDHSHPLSHKSFQPTSLQVHVFVEGKYLGRNKSTNFLEHSVWLASVCVCEHMHGRERETGIEGKQWKIALFFSDSSTIVKQKID